MGEAGQSRNAEFNPETREGFDRLQPRSEGHADQDLANALGLAANIGGTFLNQGLIEMGTDRASF